MKQKHHFFRHFIICGILGWCLEILFTSFHSFRRKDFRLTGNTSMWMFPIYGLGAFLAPVCYLVRNRNMIFRGSLYALLIFLGEYLTGTLLQRRELCPWDYSRSRWNIGNVIRLDYLPVWFLTGLFFEQYHRTTFSKPVQNRDIRLSEHKKTA